MLKGRIFNPIESRVFAGFLVFEFGIGDMALVSAFLEILQRPAIGEVMFELMVFMAPIWIAVLVGVLVGWAWKPSWANLNMGFLDSTANKGDSNESAMMFTQFAASVPSLSSLKRQVPTCISWISDFATGKETSSLSSISSPEYRLVLTFLKCLKVVNCLISCL